MLMGLSEVQSVALLPIFLAGFGVLVGKVQRWGVLLSIAFVELSVLIVVQWEFGVSGSLTATEEAMNPAVSKDGIKMISASLLLEDPDSPVA